MFLTEHPLADGALLALAALSIASLTWTVVVRRRLARERASMEAEHLERVALERRYRDLTEGAPDAIYTVTAEGRVLSANPAAVAFTGRSEEELRAHSILDIVTPGERERVRARLKERFAEGGDASPFEVEIFSPDGRTRIMEVTSRVLRPAGQPPCLEGVARDITERRRTADALATLLATTAIGGGEEFFRLVVQQIATATGVHMALIGVFESGPPATLRTLAVWRGGGPMANYSFPLADTPCEAVARAGMCLHPAGVREAYPLDHALEGMGAESYLGVPLYDLTGGPIGLIALVHTAPFKPSPSQLDMLRILAGRAGSEIDRLRATVALQTSEERFRQLAEGTTDVVWVVDLVSGRLAYLSPSFAGLTGYSTGESIALRTHLRRLFHREDRRRVLEHMRDTLAAGRSRYAIEYRIVRADGALRWILDEGVVTRDASGRACRLSGVSRDISARKSAELALLAERERFRDLFANSPDAILVETLDGWVLDANRAATELYACPCSELIGRRFSDLVPERFRETARMGFGPLARGEQWRTEGWILRCDGTEVSVEFQVRRIEYGEHDALLVHARDISSRRQAEALVGGQIRVLECIATDQPLEATLAALLDLVRLRAVGARTGIHFVAEPDGRRLRWLAPGLEPDDAQALAALSSADGPLTRTLAEWGALGERREALPPSPKDEPRYAEFADAAAGRRFLVFPILAPKGSPRGALVAILRPGIDPADSESAHFRLAATLAGIAIERHVADAALRERAERLRHANAALLALARSPAVADGDLAGAFRTIALTAADGLGVGRVTVWLFDQENATLRRVHTHPDGSGGPEPLSVLPVAQHPAYFEAIARERFVAIHDAAIDPRVLSLKSGYLDSSGIAAMLDAGIHVGGNLVGIVSLEHMGSPRSWRGEEELFAGSLADVAALAIQASQRRLVEEALRQSEEAHRSVVSVLAEGVMVIKRDGTFASFNESACQILGATAEALQSHRIDEFPWQAVDADSVPVPPDQYPVWRTFQTGIPLSDSVLGVRRPEGGFVWLSINTRVFARDEDGTVTSVLVSFADITQRQEAEAHIRQLNAELERRVEERTADLRTTNEELAEFAYAVTHDLKSPLRSIHQLAEWLSDEHAGQLEPAALHLLDLLRQRVRRLQRLVDGLLDCARVGRTDEFESEVAVGEVIEEVVSVLAPAPQVTLDIPAELPTVRANPDRLHQVFQNLIDNAFKYLDKPAGHVAIDARRNDATEEWEFRVKDNGPGIPLRYRAKVFQIFQRLHAETDVPGSGLGLTLVKRIVEGRGGRVWIESEEGQGATFAFTWPDQGRRRAR